MKQFVALFATLWISVAAFGENRDAVRKMLLDANWQFSRDSVTWRAVDLPHDWSIEGPFDKDMPAGNDGAYLPTGKGWYVKELKIKNEKLKIERRRLYFEGVYERADIYVNGQLAGHHDYGYTSFSVDITPYLVEGNNTIVVSVDNSHQKNCRWYSGSGIYRHVWLEESGDVYFDPHHGTGMSVITTEVTDGKAKLHIMARMVNDGGGYRDGLVLTARIEGIAKQINIKFPEGQPAVTGHVFMDIPSPRLWSPSSPAMYAAQLTLATEDGSVLDETTVPFGIRTIDYDAQQGFCLNGKPMLLNGACVHHDNGFLGAASFDAAEVRKVRLMKEAGFNLLRTAHNPPSPAFLAACDSLGMLVIDEAFDGWRTEKNKQDFHLFFDAQAEKEVESMVRRDMNHPSIIAWSIGNEVIERKDIRVVHTAKLLKQAVQRIDTSRPVTEALCAWDSDWEIYDPHAAVLDIVGYNYMLHKHKSDHQRVPERVIWQTESYPADALKNWQTVRDNAYVIGDIVWTGLDYLGESGIGRWYYEGDVPGEHWERPLFPWHAAYCGDVDLTGLRKPINHYRKMLWERLTPDPSLSKRGEEDEKLVVDAEPIYMAVREPDGYHGKVKTTLWGTWPTFESWNWPGHEGKPIEVEVYACYPRVRLFLNNQLVGEQDVKDCKALFTLPYQPGTLRAEGANNNEEIRMKNEESVVLQTAGEAQRIRLTADRTTLTADGQDLVFITVELTDANGIVNPIAANELTATVKGPATIAAFGNADIKDCDRYTDATHKAWKGRALLIVRSTGQRGTITVGVQGKGLKALRPAILRAR